MNRSKTTIYNIISNTILQVLIIAYGFIVPKIILESFGSSINGLVSSITQFLAYISFLESGFGPVIKAALYKPLAKKDKQEVLGIINSSEKIFRRIALVFIVYIAILVIVYPLTVTHEYGWVYTASLIAIIGVSTFAEYYFGVTYKLFLQAKQKSYVVSLAQAVTYIVSILVIVLLAKTGASIHIIKAISGALFVLRPLLLSWYTKSKYRHVFKAKPNAVVLKQKWDALAQHIAYVIHNNTDITVITIFSSLAEVSVYSVYYLVVKGVKALVTAFESGIDSIFGDMIAKKENSNINKMFSIYEVAYNSIITVAFASTMLLITWFVGVYTKNISDADYIRKSFGVLIVASEYIWAVRQPYNNLIKAAGHFKETRKGAWIECLSNIIISVALVNWLGIVGVAIGTIVAMTIRTAEFVYHTNKYILHRSMWESVKKILLVVVETLVIVLLCNFLPYRENTDYLNWGINALMTFLVAFVVVLGFNCVFFRKELSEIKSLFTSLLHRKTSTK